VATTNPMSSSGRVDSSPRVRRISAKPWPASRRPLSPRPGHHQLLNALAIPWPSRATRRFQSNGTAGRAVSTDFAWRTSDLATTTPATRERHPSFDRAYELRDRVTTRKSTSLLPSGSRPISSSTGATSKALTTLSRRPGVQIGSRSRTTLEELDPAIASCASHSRESPRRARAGSSSALARNNQPQAALDASAEARQAWVSYLYWARGSPWGSDRRARAFEAVECARIHTSRRIAGARLESVRAIPERSGLSRRRHHAPGGHTALGWQPVQIARAASLGDLRMRARNPKLSTLTAPGSEANGIRDAGSLALAVGDRRRPGMPRSARRVDAECYCRAAHLFWRARSRYERQLAKRSACSVVCPAHFGAHACGPRSARRRATGGAAAPWARCSRRRTGDSRRFYPGSRRARARLARANEHLSRKDE
jgi:hypothetical protein